MSDFDPAFKKTILIEGGYNNDPDDRGGETNYGLSKKFLDSIGFKGDIKNITLDEAKSIYKQYFWDHYNFSSIADQNIANYLFDMFVNHSERGATLIFQKAYNEYYYTSDNKLTEDGILGSNTKKALMLSNGISPIFLCLLKIERARYYLNVVDNDPPQVKYLRGWVRRAVN